MLLLYTAACVHLPCSLPQPHECQFQGMWLEGLGSWNGTLLQQARASWHPNSQAYHVQFLQTWSELLTMTPACQLMAQQQLLQAHRRNIKARSKAKAREDPDYRVKGGAGQMVRKTVRQQLQQQQQLSVRGSGGGGRIAEAAEAAAVADVIKPQQYPEYNELWPEAAATAAAAAAAGPMHWQNQLLMSCLAHCASGWPLLPGSAIPAWCAAQCRPG